jgi:hypothetical protein
MVVAVVMARTVPVVAVGLRGRSRQGERCEEDEKDASHAPPFPSWRRSNVTGS